ncbi:MAG: hypothetical protein GDA43_13200 [Hormoscilla sp. SP5CHS1]|nr:hypothetical protein [Hormoscilla sp. SP5CHS1]
MSDFSGRPRTVSAHPCRCRTGERQGGRLWTRGGRYTYDRDDLSITILPQYFWGSASTMSPE